MKGEIIMKKFLLINLAGIGVASAGALVIGDFVKRNRNPKIDEFMKETDLDKAREIMKQIKIDAENKVKARG